MKVFQLPPSQTLRMYMNGAKDAALSLLRQEGPVYQSLRRRVERGNRRQDGLLQARNAS